MVYARPFMRSESNEDRVRRESQERLNHIQEEMIQTQIKYQKELERLEKENKELRKQNILLKQGKKPNTRKIKRNLIDMYSEVSIFLGFLAKLIIVLKNISANSKIVSGFG